MLEVSNYNSNRRLLISEVKSNQHIKNPNSQHVVGTLSRKQLSDSYYKGVHVMHVT